MEETGTLTETGGAPDTRRDEQDGAESATTLMDTDLPDYEEDTDERVLDEDSGDETEDTPRHMRTPLYLSTNRMNPHLKISMGKRKKTGQRGTTVITESRVTEKARNIFLLLLP
jgi:hypothetical protein